jgi:predicted DNA-binding protein (UPF0251 family)
MLIIKAGRNDTEMPRPHCCRRVSGEPPSNFFKPRGIPLVKLEEVVLAVDELEALRLADKEGMYQDQAAEQMKISRATFGRIAEQARRKVAEALVEGKALRIEGGNFVMAEMRTFQCSNCRHTWQVPFGTGRPVECPNCHSREIRRAEEGHGAFRRGRGFGRSGGHRRRGFGRGRRGFGPEATP